MENLNEEAVDLIETYLTEDDDIADLFEDGEIDEYDIISLHEALTILDEWDELIEASIPNNPISKSKKMNKNAAMGSNISSHGQSTRGVVANKPSKSKWKPKQQLPNVSWDETRRQVARRRFGNWAAKNPKKVKFGKYGGAVAAGATAAGIGASAYRRYKNRKQNR